MVAYSFKAQFAEPIITGTKRQTIRADRKRHARPGERLQLFTGMRTKQCRKILDLDPVCVSVTPIEIYFPWRGGLEIWVGLRQLSGIEVGEFAKADGFENSQAMKEFWEKNHGDGPFKGVMITWGEP